MLPGLIPADLHHLPDTTECIRRTLSHVLRASWLAFAVFGAIDRFDSGWLDRISYSGSESRANALGWKRYSDILRDADDQAKGVGMGSLDQNVTWRLRIKSNPIALDAAEFGRRVGVGRLRVALRGDSGTSLWLVSAPELNRSMFYYRLQEAALLDRAPALTARFLTSLALAGGRSGTSGI